MFRNLVLHLFRNYFDPSRQIFVENPEVRVSVSFIAFQHQIFGKSTIVFTADMIRMFNPFFEQAQRVNRALEPLGISSRGFEPRVSGSAGQRPNPY